MSFLSHSLSMHFSYMCSFGIVENALTADNNEHIFILQFYNATEHKCVSVWSQQREIIVKEFHKEISVVSFVRISYRYLFHVCTKATSMKVFRLSLKSAVERPLLRTIDSLVPIHIKPQQTHIPTIHICIAT